MRMLKKLINENLIVKNIGLINVEYLIVVVNLINENYSIL